jgi:hypothetical protein
MWSNWVVAGSEIAMACATAFLGWQARAEARAVKQEAADVAEQVRLHRKQLVAASRPVLVPAASTGWSDGTGAYESSRWAAFCLRRMLVRVRR